MMMYFKFISMSFQKSIAYRVEYFTSVLNAFLYIFIFTSVWSALIPAGSSMSGLSKNKMIAYAVLSTLIKASMGRNESLISSRVKSGEIAVDLMKPFSIPLMYLSDTLGTTLFQILSRSIPLLIFCYVIFDIDINITYIILFKFFPVYILAFIIFFLMLFLISSISFFIVDIFPILIFYWALITLASGAIIPLDFLPEAFSRILLFTPFPYLFYFPTMILLDRSFMMSYEQLIINYILMIAVITVLANSVYSIGIRKLSIVGG